MDVEEEILSLKERIRALEEGTPPGGDGDAVPDVRREVADGLEALGVEITGLRWQAKEYYASGHAQLLERLDDLRITMHQLELRLDQIVKRNGDS